MCVCVCVSSRAPLIAHLHRVCTHASGVANADGSLAQLTANKIPCEIPSSSAILQARARPRVQISNLKGDSLLHLKSKQQLIWLYLKRSTGHQWAGLAILSKAPENLCSPAKDAPSVSEGNGSMQDNAADFWFGLACTIAFRKVRA